MSAGQTPSDAHFWDSTDRKIIFSIGGGVLGGSQMHHHHQENQYRKKMLSLERVKGLNDGSLNPSPFIMRASEDGIRTSQMKQELVAWGDKWKGTDFANPEAFSVTEEWNISQEPTRKFLRLKDRYCNLNVRKSDRGTQSEYARFSSASTAEQSVPTTEQKEKEKATKRLGRRGGKTELMEVQKGTQQLNNNIEMATHRSNYSPNSVYEVAAEEVQAVPDQSVWHSYTFTSPQEVGPIPFYLFSIVLVFTSTILLSYVQHKFLKWINSTNSQKPDSTIPENRTLGKPSGEEQKLEESATRATPHVLLETFKSYQSKTISKKKAAYILVNFYNLSEVEALELLDE